MTIPTFISDWLKDNGFKQQPQGYNSWMEFKSKDTVMRFFELNMDCHGRGKFTIATPSNEQDFLTLMNILLK